MYYHAGKNYLGLHFTDPVVLCFVFSVKITIHIMTYTAKRGVTHLAVREQDGKEVVKFKVPPSLK
jgi:hypothetical protein